MSDPENAAPTGAPESSGPPSNPDAAGQTQTSAAKGLATASLIASAVGVAGVLMDLGTVYVGIDGNVLMLAGGCLAIVGLALGDAARKRVREGAGRGAWKAASVAGMVLGVVGIALFLLDVAVPKFVTPRSVINERSAASSLRTYASVQYAYNRANGGKWAASLAELAGPQEYIPKEFALAEKGAPGAKPYRGYWYVLLKTRGGKPIEGPLPLCAFPEKYEKSGYMTFLIEPKEGYLFQKATSGEPVTDCPADPAKAGWIVWE